VHCSLDDDVEGLRVEGARTWPHVVRVYILINVTIYVCMHMSCVCSVDLDYCNDLSSSGHAYAWSVSSHLVNLLWLRIL
jgi:hypothetical protein